MRNKTAWKATIRVMGEEDAGRFPRDALVVPEDGLEPSRGQAPRDFKSLVSTHSTTQAPNNVGGHINSLCRAGQYIIRFLALAPCSRRTSAASRKNNMTRPGS